MRASTGHSAGGSTRVMDVVGVTRQRNERALRLRRGVVGALLTAFGLVATPLCGDTPHAPEYAIKAAFLYNFALFTQWPEDTHPTEGAALRLCVLGQDPFGKALRDLAGSRVQGRPLSVERAASAAEARACHILFISRSEEPRLAAILDALGESSILTVGDSEGLARRGVVISLFLARDRVAFDVNTHAARAARLAISAKVLRLARTVY